MATSKTTKRNTKATPKAKPKTAAGSSPRKTRQATKTREITGFLFLVLGLFILTSIVSYFFSWKNDQNFFFAQTSISDFVFNSTAKVDNICGKMGAAIGHSLVYKGAGIASLAIAFFIISIGIVLLSKRKYYLILRYLRWSSIFLLVIAPVLSYCFPDAAFPYGGAWGDESIRYLNGLFGKTGTGLGILSVVLFFIFIVFALDITPIIRRVRNLRQLVPGKTEKSTLFVPDDLDIPTVNEPDDMQTGITETEEMPVSGLSINELFAKNESKEPVRINSSGNALNGITGSTLSEAQQSALNQSRPGRQYDMTLTEKISEEDLSKEDRQKSILNSFKNLALETIPEEPAEGLVYNTVPPAIPSAPPISPMEPVAAEEDVALPIEHSENVKAGIEAAPGQMQELSVEVPAEVIPSPAKEDLDFEVINATAQSEPMPTITHGAHISIENNEPYAPELDLPDYKFPTLDLLEDRSEDIIPIDKAELEKNKNQIISTLRSFGIEIQRISATVGPTVTLYEIVPAEGVRISKIRNLEDDIALNLAALGIRIIAPIPGRGTIGIEVPNATKQVVAMRNLLASEKFVNNKMSLPVALGKKIDNENYIVDLATMPHLLMAGATGQGKSVGINTILVSLLYKKHPSQLKFVLVDPKKVELSIYRAIERHFLAKLPNEEEAIITDTKKVINTLNALCIEMDNRYELLKEAGTRNIKEYNDKFIARRLNPDKGHKFLPFIVLVVDEFADLIMTAGKEVEIPIARLAQLARAIGIHLIIATQRPSVNVITGTIKANFPARIAFRVSAKVDSRTILDAGGAEQLVGRGDMLVSHGSELLRLQCAFVDTPEVEQIVDFIGNQRGYPSAFELPEYEGDDEGTVEKNIDLSKRDKMFAECARLVVSSQSGSTSNLQRKFNIGYNRAGRIMDQLEAAGIVGPAVGSKPREVLFYSEAELEEFLDSLI